jgi:predicted PurR-regulated permease PerM
MNKPNPAPIQMDIEGPDSVPLSSNLNSLFLGGIFLLIFFTAIHAASEIVIPIVLAFVLKLVLQPVLRSLTGLHLPRSLAAGMIIIVLVSSIIGLGTVLSVPAATWGEKIPDSYPQLQERLNFLRRPVEKTQKILGQAENITKGGQKAVPVTMQGTRLSDKVLIGTQALATGLFTTMLVLFFLLAAGDTFLRRLVEVLPRFKDKRQVVDISQQIEQDISIYLLTITIMNALVGVGTALVMWSLHVDDPILWGALAFLLNYVPIIGPMLGVLLFLLVGLLVISDFQTAFLPATLYLLIHLTEGSIITPMLLARRFTLNPVLVILSLVFWYWMWGIPGAILAMPMLAVTKIICDRIQNLSAFGHFLEG